MSLVLNVTEILKRSDGSEVLISGDSKFYAQSNYSNLLLIDVEDGGSLNANALLNFTQQTRQSFTSHWFFMKPIGIVTKIVNEEVITAYQYAIQVPKLVLQNNTKVVIQSDLSFKLSYGTNYQGYYLTLSALNTALPPTEELETDKAVAYVVATEEYYQVQYNSVDEVYEWVVVEFLDLLLTEKTYSLSSIYIQPSFSSPQGIAPISTSNTQVIMSILNDLQVLYNSLNNSHNQLQSDVVDIINGTTIVEKAKRDQNGNIIDVTYATKVELGLVDSDLQGQIDDVVSGVTPITFDKTGTDLVSETLPNAIKEVNDKANDNEQNINDIKDGTTIVKKAEQDKNGNDIVDTYETKADATSKLALKADKTYVDAQDQALDERVEDLETANMIKSFSYNTSTHVITFTHYDGTTTSMDLPLESAIVSASYDDATQDITFVLQSGATLVVPLDDLVSGLASETWVNTYFIPKTAIVDNTTTDDANKVLSAKQGKVLQDTKADKISSETFKIIDINGKGDYTTISSALLDITTDSESNIITLFVLKGKYNETVDLIGRYINLVGIDKNDVVIYTDTGHYDFPPLKCGGGNICVSNITLLATHENPLETYPNNLRAYAIHADYFDGGICLFENVKAISYQSSALGAGTFPNDEKIFKNCDFISSNLSDGFTPTESQKGAVFIHSFPKVTVGYQYFKFYNCKIDSGWTNALRILQNISSFDVLFEHCYIVNESLKTISLTDTIGTQYINIDSYGNNNEILNNYNGIIPTLTNATTGYLKYKKDYVTGKIEIFGNINVTVGGVVFTMPSGFRPISTLAYSILKENGSLAYAAISASTGNVSIPTTGLHYINISYWTI